MSRVAVVGGGIAGLTAALRLAERGCDVTLYEQQPVLGGDLSSRRGADDGAKRDVYPHMFPNWYHNFWRLVSDVTDAPRDERFVPMSSVKQLVAGEFPRYTALTDFYSPWRALQNLFSGVAPPADIFLFMYASVDLLAEHLHPTVLLDELSVNGFLHARPYMTARAADAFNSWITRVWAIPSYLVSAADYQTFLKHGYAQPVPAFWLLRGAAEDRVIDPIAVALVHMGAEIRCSSEVVAADCAGGRVREITVRTGSEEHTEPVDDVIVAIPPPALSRLIRAGAPGRRIVDAEPSLAEVSRLRTEAIPIVHLHFTRKLDGIPPQPVGLVASSLGLAFTDVSQIWGNDAGLDGRTVLALSSSDRYGLPGTGPQDDAMAMIRELARYVTNFDPGTAWGESDDIDWTQTAYDENVDTQLFINQTGCDLWRPPTTSAGLVNLALAGDACENHIGLAAVESAVVTGLMAARAVAQRRGLTPPVEIVRPEDFPTAFFAWLRIAWMPYAAAAKMWSSASDVACTFRNGLRDGGSVLRHLFSPTRARRQR